MRALPTTKLHLRPVATPQGAFTVAVVGALAGLEVIGRSAPSDLYDAAGLVFLVVTAGAVLARHRARPVSWVAWLARRGRALYQWGRARLTGIDLGVDLRGDPPVPQRFPKGVLAVMAGLAGLVVLALAGWADSPGGWRGLGTGGSYVAYLLMLGTLWAALGVLVMVGLFAPVKTFTHLVRGRPAAPGTPEQREELLALMAYSVLLMFLMVQTALPAAAVMAGLAAVGVTSLAAAAWPGRASMNLLWRHPSRGRAYGVTPRRGLLAGAAAAILIYTGVIVAAAGGRLIGAAPAAGDMPLTSLIGTAALWLTPGLFACAVVWLAVLRRHDPGRRDRPLARVHAAGDADLRGEVEKLFRARGWEPLFDREDPAAVGVRLVPPSDSRADEFDPDWPLAVSAQDLRDGAVFGRFDRRRELDLRRQFLRKLGGVFKHDRPKSRRPGNGYWLAPHWWFLVNVIRDESASGPRRGRPPQYPIGDPFPRLLHRQVRQYMHRVLRALSVDLIFVEDGVGYPRLKKVLRAMFELFDKTNGEVPAEEKHFAHLPKVKVVIHEAGPDNPFRDREYPEPSFDELSRVRVMHVFRDRGGEEEPLDAPFDHEATPAGPAVLA